MIRKQRETDLAVSDAPNPYAATTLELGKPAREHPLSGESSGARLIRLMVVVAIPLLLIGAATAVMNIRCIVFSGTIMLIYGLLLMFLTRKRHQRHFRWFAWACCVFPILIFLIIFERQWDPPDAQIPISVLCCAFAVAMTGGILMTFALPVGPATSEFGEVALNSDIRNSIVGPDGVSSAGSPAKAP